MWFTRVSLKNPVFATMVMLAFVVMGLFAFQKLKVDQFPNIDFPVVVVLTEYPGASPEIVESEVSKKIEEGVNAIAGISALTSRSYENQSVVVIEFQLNMDGRKAADDVREKVAGIRATLRDEVKEPRVIRFDPTSRAVWSLAVFPDSQQGAKGTSLVELTNYSEQIIKKRLENVRGVGAVNVLGGSRREINIYLRPDAMESLGVSADQIAAAVRNENQDLPVGSLRSISQERVIQVQSRVKRPEDFANIIVARKGTTPIRLAQVATIKDGAQELENMALYNGERTLMLTVQKAQDANTIEVVDGLYATLTELRKQIPAGIRLEPVSDSSRQIRVAVDNVRRTLIEGALLTVLIVFLFLNSWRSTVITGLTLPISLIGTFWFMSMFGFTVNMITLMALSLCVGLLIDDAIVVRENIVRHVQMGKKPYDAAMIGTEEIGLAVLATTLSIVAVFLPIGFMEGIIGKFFHEFGITIVAAVLISMFVSFTLDPMLSSVWHDPSIHMTGDQLKDPKTSTHLYDRTIGRVTHWFNLQTDRMAEKYQSMLAWALDHKKSTLSLAVGIFITSVLMVPLLGTEFVPKGDYSETTLNFQTPVGTSLEATALKAKQVEQIVREFPEVKYTLTGMNTPNAQGKNNASIYIRLVDRKLRQRSVEDISVLLRQRLSQVAGITVTHVGTLDSVGGNKQIEFSLQGPDQRELERLTLKILEQVRTIPGLVDLDSSVKPNKPSIAIQLKRESASEMGLSVAPVSGSLRTLVAGQTVGNWRAPDDQTYDVNVRLAPEFRNSPQDLERIPFSLPSADGSTKTVRLGQIASVEETSGSNQINRRDLMREVSINANASRRSAGEISNDIRKILEASAWPPGYRYQFGGSTKSMNESFQYALTALMMAVIFIYMILGSQFKSFLQPLALMTSLPLTLIGVVLALMTFRSALSMFSVIGVVMLMGLVTKNAILLVDFTIRAREGSVSDTGETVPGLSRNEALLMAAKVRLRPILMTTLAMIFGMMPLAFAITEGSEQRAPMGQAVIGGVITSSLLTLVVVPVVYCYMDDLGEYLKRLWHGKPKSSH
ncbi:efflux RND transporter permease subunit [Limnohabitans sp. Rim11]|uniref:efflux RND transporter permease subunit n=1 Tax=Limnohabitans sp. Rim11 TaxID=1100719 RepID=UPI000A5AC863|nr:efflux RND transporter permease subunit [Limnohabitans sp. Rim11]